MARCLFTVEDTFFIEDRGLVLIPQIVSDETLRAGDLINLRRPDGSVVPTVIGSLEMLHGPPSMRCHVVIVLNKLGRDDVAIGTEGWSAEEKRA